MKIVRYVLDIFISNELRGEIQGKEEKSFVIIKKNIDNISFNTVFKSLENYGEKINNIETDDELEKLFPDCVREKNYNFSFKNYIEKN